jgi:hypothetical protein
MSESNNLGYLTSWYIIKNMIVKMNLITILMIIELFVGPWLLFQFLNPQNRWKF